MTPKQKNIIILVATAFFMEGLDGSIMNTSLPQIAFSLGTSPLHLKIALTTYLLTAGIFIPISGWLADKFGTKVMLRFSFTVFLAGSIVCGLSQSVLVMVLGRIIQGFGGALSIPVGRLLFVRNFTRAEFVNAMTAVATFALIGPSAGPLIGGLITTYIHWRFIFFVNIPVVAFALYYVQKHIENEQDLEVKPFDFMGFILLGLSLAALLFALDTIIEPFISRLMSLMMLFLGAFGLGFYYLYAHKKDFPVISPILFKNKAFSTIIFGSLFIRMSLGALPFMGPLLLQMSFGMTAMQAGLYTGTSALSMLATKHFVNRILQRFGLYRVLIANAVLISLGLTLNALMCFYPHPWFILLVLMLNGAFSSLQFSAMNSAAYSNLSAKLQSMGTSFISSFQQITQSFGIALAAFVLGILLQSQLNVLHYPARFFAITFLAISLLPLISSYIFWRATSLSAALKSPEKTVNQTNADH